MKGKRLSFLRFLSEQPQDLQKLFIKIINLHAARQIDKPSKKELLGRIRNEIIQAAKNGRQ